MGQLMAKLVTEKANVLYIQEAIYKKWGSSGLNQIFKLLLKENKLHELFQNRVRLNDETVFEEEILKCFLETSLYIIFDWYHTKNRSLWLYIFQNSSEEHVLLRVIQLDEDLPKHILTSDNEDDIDKLFRIHLKNQEKLQEYIVSLE